MDALNRNIEGDRWLIGQKYGALTVIDTCEYGIGKDRAVMAECDCGTIKKVRIYNLTRRDRATHSCGCQNIHNKSHGMSFTPTYSSYASMKNRCLDPKHKNYHNYGGKGIKICQRWLDDFKNFLEDMGERPEGMTLDRFDNSLDYNKSNCKWSTNYEQALTRSTTFLIRISNEIRSATEWSIMAGHSAMHVTKQMREHGVDGVEAIYKGASDEFLKKYPRG